MNQKIGLALSTLCLAVTVLTTPATASSQDITPTTAATLEGAPGERESIVASPIPPSQVNEATDLETAMATLEQYVDYGPNGERRFDAQRANTDNASDYLLAAGREFNRFATTQDGAGGEAQTRDMPGYGNWCGPGNSGPGEPVNTLDRLCQQHDRCYANRGYFACSCDRELIQGIRDNRGNFNGFGENTAALAIATCFNSALCNPAS